MRTLFFIVVYSMLNCVKFSAQDLLPESQKLNKDTTFVEDGYTYQCDVIEAAKFVTLYNKENKWTNVRHVYKSTGKMYGFDGKSPSIKTFIEDSRMMNKAYSIIDNAFTRSTASLFGNRKFNIIMRLDSETGKVIDVEFNFTSFSIYARVPITIYRDIEVKLKEEISFTTTAVGKQLNYVLIGWSQFPRGALPPIDPSIELE